MNSTKSMGNGKLLVGIYMRVSTGKQVQDGFSLDAQKQEGNQFAYRLFGENINIAYYVDEGISGKSIQGRNELKRMMNDVVTGNLDAIITYKVSRLSRSLSDSLKLVEEIHKEKVRFISIKEGEYGTPHGNLQFNILASVAQYQREELAENVQLGMSQRAKEGKWNGGQVLGYKNVNKQLVIVPEEAETIQIIYDKYAHEGWGLKKITNYLNSIGKTTKRGKPFSIGTISTILDNPVYKGYIRFNQVTNWAINRRKGKNPDCIITKGIHEPIIDEITWDKVAQLRKAQTSTPRQYSGTFPLTSIVRCPNCGSYMTSVYGAKRKDGTKYRYYTCGQYHNKGKSVCKPIFINADWLEKAVFERLAKALQSDSVIERITESINKQIEQQPTYTEQTKEMKILESHLTKLESSKKNIQKLMASNSRLYTENEAAELINEIRNEIDETKNKIFELKEHLSPNLSIKPVSTEFVRQQLQEFVDLSKYLEVEEFRQLLVASIKKIEATKNNLKHIQFSFIC